MTKSAKTTTRNKNNDKERFNKIKLLTKNVETKPEDIQRQANDDEEIDLDKIRKYFKSVINEQNFLRNYERIKNANN
jgi:hypothetical protein